MSTLRRKIQLTKKYKKLSAIDKPLRYIALICLIIQIFCILSVIMFSILLYKDNLEDIILNYSSKKNKQDTVEYKTTYEADNITYSSGASTTYILNQIINESIDIKNNLEEVEVIEEEKTIEEVTGEIFDLDPNYNLYKRDFGSSWSEEDYNYVWNRLAHLIYAEAGANYCSDVMQMGVASVAINRLCSDKYPNTIDGVIFQNGQYSCTWNGMYEREPDERAWSNAKKILDEGCTLPKDVLYQAEFTQGTVYLKEAFNNGSGTRYMYFCK